MSRTLKNEHENFLRDRDKSRPNVGRHLSRIRKKTSCPTLCAICHGLLKHSHAPAEDRTGDPSIYSLALYHIAIKAGLYRKAVQVYDIPNQYPVTYVLTFLRNYYVFRPGCGIKRLCCFPIVTFSPFCSIKVLSNWHYYTVR